MRYAVLADIHGNLPALEAVLADVSALSVDEILVAGDLASGCPYPHETVALLRSIGCRCIRGNNEGYLINIHRRTCHPGVLTSLQWGATRWAYSQLSSQDLDWLASLPAQLSLESPTGGIRMVHGTLDHDAHSLIPDRDERVIAYLRRLQFLKPADTIRPLASVFTEISEEVLIAGHIHIPWQQREGRGLAFNPGSVGAPNNADPRAQYALLSSSETGWELDLRSVEYDITTVEESFQSRGLLAAGGGFARACMLDIRRACNTVWRFVQFSSAYARAHGSSQPIIPDELWLEAEACFDWDQGCEE